MKVFPVVHINSPEVATTQAELALSLGADGVYLIDHHLRNEMALFDTLQAVTKRAPDAYIGANILSLSPLESLQAFRYGIDRGLLDKAPSGLWSDDALSEVEAGETLRYRRSDPELSSVRYLGGLVFKYTEKFTEDPEEARTAVQQDQHRVDLVVTSGEGTGKAPTVEKIRAMKEAAGSLAVASGITIDNLSDYAGLIDEVLIASSVETNRYSGIFEPCKLQAFITKAHQL